MLIAYVWNLSEPANTKIFVLSHQEAVGIATEMKYTATESPIGKGVQWSPIPAGSWSIGFDPT